jgi:hypothetical protein
LAGCALVAVVPLVSVAGCAGQNGLDLARQACRHVETSLSLYQQSQVDPPPADAQVLAAKALVELRTALPLASLAASDSGEWQALRATLAESSRVREANLVTALHAQCQDAFAGGSAGG